MYEQNPQNIDKNKKKITFGAFEMDISGSVLEKDQILSNLPLKIIAIYANR